MITKITKSRLLYISIFKQYKLRTRWRMGTWDVAGCIIWALTFWWGKPHQNRRHIFFALNDENGVLRMIVRLALYVYLKIIGDCIQSHNGSIDTTHHTLSFNNTFKLSIFEDSFSNNGDKFDRRIS